jgi:hypothetical protein
LGEKLPFHPKLLPSRHLTTALSNHCSKYIVEKV